MCDNNEVVRAALNGDEVGPAKGQVPLSLGSEYRDPHSSPSQAILVYLLVVDLWLKSQSVSARQALMTMAQ